MSEEGTKFNIQDGGYPDAWKSTATPVSHFLQSQHRARLTGKTPPSNWLSKYNNANLTQLMSQWSNWWPMRS